MKKPTRRLFASLTAAIVSITTPAFAEVYECTFKAGHVAKPTPTRVVIEVDDYQREGKLLEIEIPGVVTRPGPITVTRNNIKVVAVEWTDPDYEFTEEAKQNGARSGTSYVGKIWGKVMFSVFLKKQNLTASTRSSYRSDQPIAAKSGRCVRLK